MAEGGKKSGGGFIPGLVLGVIVGAATAFVALEVLDSNRLDIDPSASSTTGERLDREAENLERGAQELGNQAEDVIEDAGDGLEEAVDDAGDAIDDAVENLDPPSDPSDG
jgi:gas vesicle protein